ncbi:YezD family protein [Paludisphaera sp.]|uniref:YezD family protein n=1 Tax=Paludisphaera sp. TaxID=2017432 RepID=UPI00301BEEDE
MNDRVIATGGGSRTSPVGPRDSELEQIREAVRGIRYGEVRVIIQDGLIVQIERLEKQRFR